MLEILILGILNFIYNEETEEVDLFAEYAWNDYFLALTACALA